jgi:hypothetical protein
LRPLCAGPISLREFQREAGAIPRGFSLLLTGTQAAERLGISVQRVLRWAAEGRLPIAGQDEDGRALFREHVIETIGEDLVALVPPGDRRLRKMRAT